MVGGHGIFIPREDQLEQLIRNKYLGVQLKMCGIVQSRTVFMKSSEDLSAFAWTFRDSIICQRVLFANFLI